MQSNEADKNRLTGALAPCRVSVSDAVIPGLSSMFASDPVAARNSTLSADIQPDLELPTAPPTPQSSTFASNEGGSGTAGLMPPAPSAQARTDGVLPSSHGVDDLHSRVGGLLDGTQRPAPTGEQHQTPNAPEGAAIGLGNAAAGVVPTTAGSAAPEQSGPGTVTNSAGAPIQSGQGAGTTGTVTNSALASGLKFNITFDQSTASAPAAFFTAFNDAIQAFEQTFSDPITINLTVSWGSNYSLGESESYIGYYTYQQVRNALAADASSTTDSIALASLPTVDPTNGDSIEVTDALAKALGLRSATSGGLDGWVAFNSQYAFDFNPSNRAAPGEIDFIGVAEHEISEVMGRISDMGGGVEAVLDLFRYSAPGVRALSPSNNAYFSIDGGKTAINTFNGINGGDLGDWAGATADSFNAFASWNQVDDMTAGDITVLDALGYNLATNTTNSIVQPDPMDFDGDGKADILWQNSDGQAAVWLMNGAAPVSMQRVGSNPGSAWVAKTAADFDGDGKADILWQNSDGQAAIWFMNGTSLTIGSRVAPNPGNSWQIVGAGDFNGDGKADILWQNSDGQAAIWLMNGATPTSMQRVGPNPGSAWHIVGTGDFDGDGKADILWQNSDGQAAIWLMNGTTPTSMQRVGPNPGSAWQIEGVGDFDGNGTSDILWQNTDGQAAIWLMNGTTPTTMQRIGADPGSAWHVVGAGDYNGDGKADILWQKSDGQAAIWLMNGTSITAMSNAGPNPGSTWHPIASA